MHSRIIKAGVVAAAFFALAGCRNMSGLDHQTAHGDLDAEPLKVMARAQEFGFDVVGNASGTAESRKFLFLTIGGDRIDASLPLFGQHEGSELDALAALRAARSQGGDGFYITTTERERANLLWIYRHEKVTVNGKVLRTKDLGTMSADRADQLRKADAAKPPSLFGLFGH